MSLLAIALPPRDRRPASGAIPTSGASSEAPAEWRFAFSRDGRTLERQGQARASGFPEAARVVLVADALDVAWMRARIPKVRGHKLQAALRGLLEDDLAGDVHRAHLALGPSAAEAQGTTWVAALDLSWLQVHLQALSDQAILVDALVCEAEPASTWSGHARLAPEGRVEAVCLGPQGVAVWPLPLAPHLLASGGNTDDPHLSLASGTWTAEPQAVQALTEAHAIEAQLQGAGARLISAAHRGTNLLQFELTPKARASRLLSGGWTRFMDPSWRAVHVGLAVLMIAQVVGLCASAWQSQRTVAELDQRSSALLQATFPSVKVVVDAPLQMRRELDSLRASAGVASATDLESWLDVAAPLWRRESAPLKSIRFKAGIWTLETTAAAWPAAVVAALGRHAEGQGWSVFVEGPKLVLKPSAAKG